MRIVHLDDDPLMRELVSLLIQKEFGLKTISCSSFQELQMKLQLGEQVDLILSDYHMPEATGGDVFRHVKTHYNHVPFVLVSSELPQTLEEFKTASADGYILKSNLKKSLKSELHHIIQTSREIDQLLQPDFIAVNVESLKILRKIPCDLYLKIGEKKFVRLFKKDQMMDDHQFIKYTNKGVREFLIPDHSIEPLVDKLLQACNIELRLFEDIDRNDTLRQQINQVEPSELKEELDKLVSHSIKLKTQQDQYLPNLLGISEKTHKLLLRCFENWKVDLKSQLMINASISCAIQSIDQTPAHAFLAKNKIVKLMDDEKYIMNHSFLLAQVGNFIAHEMGWSSHILRYKISMAAFLHDIAITNPQLAKIDSLRELEHKASHFSKSEQDQYKRHTQFLRELNFTEEMVPADVLELVENHHERPDASGFPRGLKAESFTPIVALFIIAQDLTSFMLEEDSHLHLLQRFCQMRQKTYTLEPFQKIFQTLKTQSLPKEVEREHKNQGKKIA